MRNSEPSRWVPIGHVRAGDVVHVWDQKWKKVRSVGGPPEYTVWFHMDADEKHLCDWTNLSAEYNQIRPDQPHGFVMMGAHVEVKLPREIGTLLGKLEGGAK